MPQANNSYMMRPGSQNELKYKQERFGKRASVTEVDTLSNNYKMKNEQLYGANVDV